MQDDDLMLSGRTQEPKLNVSFGVNIFGILMALIVLLAAGVRIVNLSTPDTLIFDETYYVKDAWAQSQTGVPREWANEEVETDGVTQNITNQHFANGITNEYSEEPSFAAHPPLGKTLIAAGFELDTILGGKGVNDPTSWRIMTAIAGILSVLILMLSIKKLLELYSNQRKKQGEKQAKVGANQKFLSLSKPEVFALIGGFLLAVDGQAIVMSRVGILDQLLCFMVLLSFYFWVLAFERAEFLHNLTKYHTVAKHFPSAEVQFWLIPAFIFGLSAGIKWSGAYFLAALIMFAYISYFRVARGFVAPRKTRLKERAEFSITKLARGMPVSIFMALAGFIGYILTWVPWFLTPNAYNRDGSKNPITVVIQWFNYHLELLDFHKGLETPHTYQSNALSWMLQLRPTSFYYETPEICSEDTCSSAITSLGNPLIWWVCTLAFAILLGLTIYRCTRMRAFILLPLLAGWLPWVVLYSNRTIFTFYSVVMLPFMIVILIFIIYEVSIKVRHLAFKVILVAGIVVFLICVAVISYYFWPIWTAKNIPYSQWYERMWLPSWI